MSQIDRRINNIEAQIAGFSVGSGVQSVVAGTNVTITGTASNPVINSTGGGITSLVAGTGISISGTSPTLTVSNTGITSLVAGTGISVSGSTITNSGVVSVTAGSNTSITGTASNPIINLVPSAGVSLNINDADFVVPVAQLANCYLFSSSALTAPRTISFPNFATLQTQYGANAVIPFFWANMRQPSPVQATILAVVGDNTPSNVFFNQSVLAGAWSAVAPTPSSGGFILDYKGAWRGTCVLDSTLGNAYYTFTWLTTFA